MPMRDIYDQVIADVERPLIQMTLSATRGNQIKAAAMLGLNRNTLRKKIRDLDIPVAVVGVPTVREPDGLALSSRNIYLSPSQRETAAVLPSALREGARRIAAGDTVEAVLGRIWSRLETAGFSPVDYVDLVDAISLEPVRAPGERPLRLAAAAWLGRTRLIDNWPAGLADAAD